MAMPSMRVAPDFKALYDQPFSLLDYEVIGFTAESVVKFKREQTAKMLVECYLADLLKTFQGYTPEMS